MQNLSNVKVNEKFIIKHFGNDIRVQHLFVNKGITISQSIWKLYEAPFKGDVAFCVNNKRIISLPRKYLEHIYVESVSNNDK